MVLHIQTDNWRSTIVGFFLALDGFTWVKKLIHDKNYLQATGEAAKAFPPSLVGKTCVGHLFPEVTRV